MATQEDIERQKELNRLKQEQLNLEDKSNESLEYASIAFKNIVDEIRGGNNQLKIAEQLQKSRVSSLTKSSNLARQLLEVAKGENTLSRKQLKNIRLKTKAEQDNLKRILQERDGLNKVIDGRTVVGRQIKQEIADLEAVLNKQDQIENTIEDTNKALGLAPAILGGFDKALQKAGFPALGISEAITETQKAAQLATGEFNAMGKFTSIVGANLKGLVSTANILAASIGFLVNALKSVDKSSGELAKNLGISYDESLAMVSSMTDVANLSMDTFITTEGLVNAQKALSTALGTNVQLSSNLLVDFTKLTEQAGYSVEAATQLSILSQATGKPAKDITTQFLGQAKALNLSNKLALNEKQLLESISKVSKGTLATFAAQPKKLSEAVFQAKKLGVEISQLESMADGLLDIESSLTAEFEAEVITGRQLNLERARYFALTNDIAGVGREIEKQGYSQQQFATATRIEQDAMAKAIGLSRDELGNMLITSEALRNTGAKNEEELRQQYESVRGTAEEQAFLNKLGNDQYAQQLRSQSVQERFNKTVAKLQDIFVSIAEPVLAIVSPFADLVNTVMPALNLAIIPIKAVFESISFIIQGIANGVRQLTEFLKENLDVALVLSGTYTTIAAIKNRTLIASKAELVVETVKNAKVQAGAAIQTAINAVKKNGFFTTIGDAAMTAFKSVATIPFVGPALGAAAAAAAYMLGKSYMQGDDIMSPGGRGYGSRTLMGPEGSIALNNKDTVIAGTNLFPDKPQNTIREENRNTTPSIDYDQLADAIAMGAEKGTSRANITTNLDGDKVSNRIQAPLSINTRRLSY